MARRTALGGTALIVGANLPDLDALAYFAGPAADLAWRRGWTHGVLAMCVLPLMLTGSLLLVDRWHRRARTAGAPTVPRQILFLSFLAILSHPVLDTLNTYGVRWLMPFSDRWFYGDALFIVDPSVWLLLAAGVVWSWQGRRRHAGSPDTPARLALGLTILYMTGMWASGLSARRIIARDTMQLFGQPTGRIMAGPRPITPSSRSFVIEQGSVYRVGTFRWLAEPGLDSASVRSYPRARPAHPALAAAESTQVMRRFLSWARFPTFLIDSAGPDFYLVHVVDLRYTRAPDRSFGSLTVPVRLGSAPAHR